MKADAHPSAVRLAPRQDNLIVVHLSGERNSQLIEVLNMHSTYTKTNDRTTGVFNDTGIKFAVFLRWYA